MSTLPPKLPPLENGSAQQPRTQRLSRSESTFFLAFIGGDTATSAYQKVRPLVTRESAGVLGARMLKRIKRKIDWPKRLEEGDLGEERLMRELNRKLSAKVTRYYQDVSLGDHEDNQVQMRAVELLAELLHKRGADVAVHVDGIQIVPAPRPDEQPPDEDPAKEGTS